MDDLNKQFQEFYNQTKAVMKKLPILAAQDAVNFFQDSFRKQGWSGETQENWKKRKSDKNKRDAGRAILVKTGRLKRSIRKIKADWDGVIVGTNVPYAAVHNDGFRGSVQVKGFVRKVASRNTRVTISGTRKKQQTSTGIALVKAHTVMMRMPRRRFLGNSPYLDKKIERTIINQLKSI